MTLGKIVASWFISPVAGGLISFIIFKLMLKFILSTEKPLKSAIIGVPVVTFGTIAAMTMGTIFKGLKHLKIDISFPEALVISALLGAIGGGISYVYLKKRWSKEAESSPLMEQLSKVEKPFVLLVIISSCSVAFAHGANDVANDIGPLAGIWEIVTTNAVPSQMGLPVSTTHTLVGAIVGVGMARGIASIDRRVVNSIMFSWVSTLPIVAILTMIFYVIATKVFGAGAPIVIP